MSIVSSSIQRHNVPTGIELLQEKENEFGILTIKTATVPLTKTPSLLLFTMDTTGSMDEPSTIDNNTTKMHYLKATFANMLRYLASLESPDIYIQVNCFDTDVRTVIQPVNVTKDNCAELIQIVQAITADGLTAIDKPLREAEKQMIQYKEAHPEHNIVHFFMTDGTPTSGETKTHILAGAVNDSFINLFIGFGENHNAELLRQCSSKKQASYLFIDNAENTAMFYGEALHQILYPAITNLRICIENGSIYDWKTNTWTETLYEDAVIGDCEKIYHLRQTPDLMTATVYGTDAQSGSALEEEVDEVPTLIDTATGLEDEIDLTLYLFRQEVMELLFDATQYAGFGRNEKRIYRENLERMFRVMRRFMREHDLEMDPFMLRLCNDVKVTHSTLNSNVGLMYSLARQTSQGRQQLFSPSNREDTFAAPTLPAYRRTMDFLGDRMGTGFWGEGEGEEEEREGSNASTVVPDGFLASDELTQYAVEESESQCYTTEGIMNTVRELSSL